MPRLLAAERVRGWGTPVRVRAGGDAPRGYARATRGMEENMEDESTMAGLIVSKANKSLVVPRVGKTVNMFPNAVRLDSDTMIVPHGLRETLMLRHLGYPCPNPMLMYYDWKGGTPFAV